MTERYHYDSERAAPRLMRGIYDKLAAEKVPFTLEGLEKIADSANESFGINRYGNGEAEPVTVMVGPGANVYYQDDTNKWFSNDTPGGMIYAELEGFYIHHFNQRESGLVAKVYTLSSDIVDANRQYRVIIATTGAERVCPNPVYEVESPNVSYALPKVLEPLTEEGKELTLKYDKVASQIEQWYEVLDDSGVDIEVFIKYLKTTGVGHDIHDARELSTVVNLLLNPAPRQVIELNVTLERSFKGELWRVDEETGEWVGLEGLPEEEIFDVIAIDLKDTPSELVDNIMYMYGEDDALYRCPMVQGVMLHGVYTSEDGEKNAADS